MRTLVSIAIGLLVLIAGAVTKPDKDAHIGQVTASCNEGGDAIGDALCSSVVGLGSLFGLVSFQDHVLYSSLSIGGDVVSTGAFGRVWLHEDEG